MRLALDSNLTLLWIVGSVSEALVERHKRLPFTIADFRLLQKIIETASAILATPNALTEVSNIFDFGVYGHNRAEVLAKLKGTVLNVEEHYVASREASSRHEFDWLGLSDCAWLALLDEGSHLLTADHRLHIAALKAGLNTTNFNHLREQYGTLR